MTTFHAAMMHGERGGEGHYEFQGPPELFDETPISVMRALMAHLDETAQLGHIEYEVSFAVKNERVPVVVVVGQLHFENDGAQPFLCMINPERA